MRRLYISAFLMLQITICSAHAFKIGLIELRPVADGVSVYARFDRVDILKALQSNCEDYNQLDQCLESYINKHVSFVFDGEKSRMKHMSHEFQDEFIVVRFHMDVQPGAVTNVDIFNDCLLEFDDDQQNIVYLYFNDMRRTFRLDKDRIRTKAAY